MVQEEGVHNNQQGLDPGFNRPQVDNRFQQPSTHDLNGKSGTSARGKFDRIALSAELQNYTPAICFAPARRSTRQMTRYISMEQHLLVELMRTLPNVSIELLLNLPRTRYGRPCEDHHNLNTAETYLAPRADRV